MRGIIRLFRRNGQSDDLVWSHKIKGLHVNDFIMAAKTDGLFDEGETR